MPSPRARSITIRKGRNMVVSLAIGRDGLRVSRIDSDTVKKRERRDNRPMFSSTKTMMPTAGQALKGRDASMPVADRHFVNGAPLAGPFPAGYEQAVFGLGCFWGAERKFWQQPGVYTTAVGYAGGFTQNPTYEEVCSGRTGHTEVVLVVFDP